ncbi:MAG: hypothetical protein AAB662_00600 [Patescibacteria group bacterium]
MRGVEAAENSGSPSVIIRRRRLMMEDALTRKELEEARGGNSYPVPEIKVQSNGHLSTNGKPPFSVSISLILTSRTPTQGDKNLADLRRLLSEREELLASNVEQRRVLSMIKEGQIVPENWRSLFDWYAQSEMFKKVIESNNGNSPVSLNGNTHRKLRSDFSGRIFEDIAFIYAAVKFAEHIVLSPKETLVVFKRIYPDRKITNFPFGKESIAGVSVPDGLVVDGKTGKVLKILEFSLDRKVNRFAGKIRTILQGKEGLTEEFGGSTFLFVIPQTFPLPKSIEDNRASVSSYQVPFSHRNFASLVHLRLLESVANKGKQ